MLEREQIASGALACMQHHPSSRQIQYKGFVVDCRLVMHCIMILHHHVHGMLTCKILVGATDTSSSVLYRVVVFMAA